MALNSAFLYYFCLIWANTMSSTESGKFSKKSEGKQEMTGKISQCNSCRSFFDSKTRLKEHIDKNHRITDSKIPIITVNVVLMLLNNPSGHTNPFSILCHSFWQEYANIMLIIAHLR